MCVAISSCMLLYGFLLYVYLLKCRTAFLSIGVINQSNHNIDGKIPYLGVAKSTEKYSIWLIQLHFT